MPDFLNDLDAIELLKYLKHDILANSPYDKAVNRAIDALNSVNRWIPCSERMPETDTPVICYMRSGQILVMELSDDDGWYCGVTRYYPRSVTHWMPLPEPPKEGESDA